MKMNVWHIDFSLGIVCVILCAVEGNIPGAMGWLAATAMYIKVILEEK